MSEGTRSPFSRPRWSLRTFWGFQIAFWLISSASLWFMIQTYYPLAHDLQIVAGRSLTGLILSTGLHWLYGRPFLRRRKGVGKWLWVCGISLLVCLGSSLGWWALVHWAGFPEVKTENLFFSLTVSRASSLLIWNSMYFGIDLYLNAQALKLETAQARLAARGAELKQLQAQLNPHFLFNALNTIKATVSNPAVAAEVTQSLADYLRFSLQESRPLEPLGRELEALALYFKIQQVRFGPELDCRMEIAPAALTVPVPPMLVQPLLENAFKYGPRTSTPLRIVVKVAIDTHWLYVDVTNSGEWIKPDPAAPPGTGLDNLRRRLHLLLGETATLESVPGPGHVTIRIRLPRTAPAPA